MDIDTSASPQEYNQILWQRRHPVFNPLSKEKAVYLQHAVISTLASVIYGFNQPYYNLGIVSGIIHGSFNYRERISDVSDLDLILIFDDEHKPSQPEIKKFIDYFNIMMRRNLLSLSGSINPTPLKSIYLLADEKHDLLYGAKLIILAPDDNVLRERLIDAFKVRIDLRTSIQIVGLNAGFKYRIPEYFFQPDGD